MELKSIGKRESIVGTFDVFSLELNNIVYKIEIINKKIRAYYYDNGFVKHVLGYQELYDLKKELNKQKQQKKFKTDFVTKEEVEEFFKQYSHTPVEEVEEEIVRKEGEFFEDEVNNLLDHLGMDEDDYPFTIDQKFCDKINDNRLLNYIVTLKIKGDHVNDGQMVDYTFTFKSPEGKVTDIHTSMCLMVGWNYTGSAIFK